MRVFGHADRRVIRVIQEHLEQQMMRLTLNVHNHLANDVALFRYCLITFANINLLYNGIIQI